MVEHRLFYSAYILIHYYLYQNKIILNVFIHQQDNLEISTDNLLVNFKVEYKLLTFLFIKLCNNISFFNTPNKYMGKIIYKYTYI